MAYKGYSILAVIPARSGSKGIPHKNMRLINGVTLIGHAIQTHAESLGYSVVRDFCGHGVGVEFHEAPQILHYGTPGTGDLMQENMVFTIEPMINMGRPESRILGDGWTAVTVDGSLSAQWEHTIHVTGEGCQVLTG